jgi:general secretion pathway protein G
MDKKNKHRSVAGFTLLELILVMVIISILATSVSIAVAGRATKARIDRTKMDLRNFNTAIEAYAIEHNDEYPRNLNALVTGEIQYIEKMQNDAWGNPFYYKVPGKSRKYDLASRGKDGQLGTEDDISYWDIE